MIVDSAASEPDRQQFTLKSVFWSTTSLALLLAYARSMGEQAVIHVAIYALLALAAGGLVGFLHGNWKDGLFWSMLVALLTYLAVEGGRLPDESVVLGWGAVGAGCGAICGVRFPKKLWLGTCLTGALGSLLLVSFLLVAGQPLTQLVQFDVACAAVVGCILRPFIEYLQWLEAQSRQPRVVLASWLALSILIGNFLVPIVGGVER